jgi:hypothetical protein
MVYLSLVLARVVVQFLRRWRLTFLLLACDVPGCLKGVVGVGFCNAWVRSSASMVAVSALDIPGTLQCCGENSIVYMMRSCPVVEQYTQWARYCSIAGPTYHALSSCGDREPQWSGFSWTITLFPGGTSGVALQLNGPFRCACADNFGLSRSWRRRFSMITAWGVSL